MNTELISENDSLHKKIIQWGNEKLTSLGYTLKNNLPENVLNKPWSYVIRFETSDGYVYLKHTPEQLALEATIIQILHDQFQASVPKVIAHNPELNCFLMRNAGRLLREILKQNFDEALLCKAIDQFTALQLAVTEHVDIFLDIGVPDWRLNKLPDLYEQLLLQKDMLIEDGLTEIEISKLRTLLPQVSSLCKKLSSYSIKQTIVQPDFNDNNILIDTISQDITIIDLGEISISHPFFSLFNCLQQMQKHYGLTTKDDIYLRIKDVCFRNHTNFESKKHFLDAFATAQSLWIIYGILTQYRLITACDKTKIMSFQRGKISNSLKEFMTICVAIE